ncbi:MAG: lysophospholipid acyltransferase family protein [Thermoleophilaceae bacterium]
MTRLLLPLNLWGRVRVAGLDAVPLQGPLLLVPNHDSQMDPVVIGVALRRRRQLRYLARANLWKIRGLGPVLNGMRQIPIERGAGAVRALDRAVEALQGGEAICIFPEGRLSMGERLRARSGVGRLAAACPGATVVLCAISGSTDYVRFPRRPRVSVSFFAPASGPSQPGEEPSELAARLLAELREAVPPAVAGRRPGGVPVRAAA